MSIIDIDNIVPYLMEKQLLFPDEIVSGELLVVDISKRNRMIKILREPSSSLSSSSSYFVKQPRTHDIKSKYFFLIESKFYAFIKEQYHFLNKFIPHYFGFDKINNILIIEFLSFFQSLNQFTYQQSNNNEIQKIIGDILGNTLATSHNTFKNEIYNPSLSFLHSEFPFIFSILRPNNEIFSK